MGERRGGAAVLRRVIAVWLTGVVGVLVPLAPGTAAATSRLGRCGRPVPSGRPMAVSPIAVSPTAAIGPANRW